MQKSIPEHLPVRTKQNFQSYCKSRCHQFDVVIYQKMGQVTRLNTHRSMLLTFKIIENRSDCTPYVGLSCNCNAGSLIGLQILGILLHLKDVFPHYVIVKYWLSFSKSGRPGRPGIWDPVMWFEVGIFRAFLK